MVGAQADQFTFYASNLSGNKEVSNWLWNLFTDLKEAHSKSSVSIIPAGPAIVSAVSPG